MTVRVKLFAVAKERVNREEVTIEIPSSATVGDLREAIEAQYPVLANILPHALWAVDAAYANDSTILNEQSDVALIPPVSGG
jgi:molybdopterin converting factor subunit 1